MEEFKTIRDFNNKFPSKIYICSKCKNMTTNPYQCTYCDNQSNNFFASETYTYKILETNTVQQIFKPIELEKGQQNG